MSKRKADSVENAFAAVRLEDGWLPALLSIDAEHLALIIGYMANSASISSSAIKKARTSLTSFSDAKWKDFATRYFLAKSPAFLELKKFPIPVYRLPQSFHKPIMETAWRTLDAFRETTEQDNESTRVRTLDSYIIPVVGLFQGRVIDKLEQPMLQTQYSTGGQVEHEIFTIGGILFFVIELKHELNSDDNLTQLFLELLSAAETNEQLKFQDLRVHGLLTDLTKFHFYSYNPPKREFCIDQQTRVTNMRVEFLSDMIQVTNKIFSVIFFAYMEGLRACGQKSRARALDGDFEPSGSSPVQQIQQQPRSSLGQEASGELNETKLTSRKSTSQWESALRLAEESLTKFAEVATSVEKIEENSTEAVKLLTRSVRELPRMSYYTGKGEPEDVSAVVDAILTAKMEDLIDK